MSLREVAHSIRTMEIRGAGEIARAGANALKDFAQGYKGKDIDRFKNRLEDGKKLLLSTRPTAISLWNALQTVTKGAKDSKDIEELRDLIVANADGFVSRSKDAVKMIGKVGSQRIKGGDRILTHCNSKAALSVIGHAFRDGKKIEVTVTESRPWRQGLQTAKELARDGIPTTLIIDSAVRWIMKDIDLVYVGADTVASNGAVINKIGTSQIALIAHEARVPFIVCAETFKFSPKTVHGELVQIEERDPGEIVKEGEIPKSVRIRNPVFDATPADYIDSIVTEVGVISPYAAYDIIVKELGQEMDLEI